MRHARVKLEGRGCYHVVSRIVDRNFRLTDAEKEIFRKMMRKAEAFSLLPQNPVGRVATLFR